MISSFGPGMARGYLVAGLPIPRVRRSSGFPAAWCFVVLTVDSLVVRSTAPRALSSSHVAGICGFFRRLETSLTSLDSKGIRYHNQVALYENKLSSNWMLENILPSPLNKATSLVILHHCWTD